MHFMEQAEKKEVANRLKEVFDGNGYPSSKPFWGTKYFEPHEVNGQRQPRILVVQWDSKYEGKVPLEKGDICSYAVMRDEWIGSRLLVYLREYLDSSWSSKNCLSYLRNNIAFYFFNPTPNSRPSAENVREWSKLLVKVIEILKPEKLLLIGHTLGRHLGDERFWPMTEYPSFKDFLKEQKIEFEVCNLRSSNIFETSNFTQILPQLLEMLDSAYDCMWDLFDFLEHEYGTREEYEKEIESEKKFYREYPEELNGYDENHPENLEDLIESKLENSCVYNDYYRYGYDEKKEVLDDLLIVKNKLADLKRKGLKKKPSLSRLVQQKTQDEIILRIVKCLDRKSMALQMKMVGIARICVDVMTDEKILGSEKFRQLKDEKLFDDTLVWFLQNTKIKRSGKLCFESDDFEGDKELLKKIQDELKKRKKEKGVGRTSWRVISATYNRLKKSALQEKKDLSQRMKKMFLSTDIAREFGGLHNLKDIPKGRKYFWTPKA